MREAWTGGPALSGPSALYVDTISLWPFTVLNVDFISPSGLLATYTGFQITDFLPCSFILALSSLLPSLSAFSCDIIYTFEFISLECEPVHLID